MTTDEQLRYYTTPGSMTDLSPVTDATAGLPREPADLCRVATGLIIHEFLTSLYGVELEAVRVEEVETRTASAMVRRILALDPRPLHEARAPERRLVGNCRQFSVLTCALLRDADIPARARCGFATYFQAGRYIDHWVVEHWDPDRNRWVRVDTQLDDRQQAALAIDFDPSDVPRDRFLTGGEAWRLCRSGGADPDHFGILEFWGRHFVRGNAIRDLAALNKIELLPWDGWGLMDRAPQGPDDDAHALVDEVASTTLDDQLPAVQRLYQENDLHHMCSSHPASASPTTRPRQAQRALCAPTSHGYGFIPKTTGRRWTPDRQG